MTDTSGSAMAWDKLLSTAAGILGIAGILVGATFWFAHLETGLTQLQVTQSAQAARLERIEESRAVGLQRLAKTEEAIASMKDALAQINGKLDRMLMRGR